MAINETEDKNVIIFNTPKKLDLKKLFPTYSQTVLDKMIYIIHQCNFRYSKAENYNLNVDNHRWFFGLSPNDMCKMIDDLVRANIIKVASDKIINIKSAYYTIVQPFDVGNEAVINKHFYRLDDRKCPLFIRKWVADSYGVRNKETTNFVKSEPIATITRKAKAPANNDKDKYIRLLELTLFANNIPLPVLQSAPAISVTIEPVAYMTLTPAIATPELNMGEAHEERELSPVLNVEAEPASIPVIVKVSPDLPPVDKAIQVLAGLRKAVKEVKPLVTEPKKFTAPKVATINTDVHVMEGFKMVNYKRYKRATQLSDTLQRMQFERKLTDLVNSGYQGEETFTIDNWLLNFKIDGLSQTVTLLEILDAKIAA